MKIRYFRNDTDYIEAFNSYIKKIVSKDGKTNIALSGGRTPAVLYSGLADSDISLSNVNFYQVDERFIDKESVHSNYFMIQNSLYKNRDKVIGGLISFDTSLPLHECLADYSKKIVNIKRLDLSILGVGVDGHFGSLFPHHHYLKIDNQECIYSETDDFNIKERVSLSLKKIMDSKKILIILHGEEKKHVLEKMLDGEDYLEFPARILNTRQDVEVFFRL